MLFDVDFGRRQSTRKFLEGQTRGSCCNACYLDFQVNESHAVKPTAIGSHSIGMPYACKIERGGA
jgi:hypothetical protein